MWRLAIILSILVLQSLFACAQDKRPTIGVALSGGGAKGLAHIGILKALDSAGIKVDYVTGTSMGSIIGALYSAGYSGKDIEERARKIDWDEMLTNQSSLRGIVMEEKDEYSRYAIELPWVNNGFKLPSGVLEGEELWLKFAELFFPVYNIRQFEKFSIPFKCITTDISTGEAVVLDSGDIISAVRASMAIPSLFTAVEYNGRRLIDGGVVRNFPVRDVKQMGADLVIGSRVAMGLQPKEKVNNALQILLQIAFMKEAIGNKEDVAGCDIYIPMPLEDYTAASFNRAEEILNFGIEEGRRLYPQFKKLADSLNMLYGYQHITENRLPKVDSILISAIEINGLEQTTRGFFEHMMAFEKGSYYTSARLSRMVRRVFGTRYYNRIVYYFQPLDDGSVKIIFDVVENASTFAKTGIHYNNFTGISLIGNITSRNFFLPHSRSMITVNLGESFRTRAEHLQYLGRGKNVALTLGVQYGRFDINTYENFKRDGLFSMQLFKADSRLQYSADRKFTIGAGTRFEWVKNSPSIQSAYDIKGQNEYVTSYGFFGVNTLNKNVYPVRGVKIAGELGFVYNQTPSVRYYTEGVPVVGPDSTNTSHSDYQKMTLNVEGYVPLSSRFTFTSMFQSGINFGYHHSILNDYIVGGLNETIRNQVLFAGVQENAISTPSVAAAQVGMRYKIFNNTYIMLRGNALVHNFISTNDILQKPKFLSGYAATFAYNFALGPLEISAMYCDQSRRVSTYINLGIAF